MRELIKKTVLRLFPELTGGYHLPRYAEVLAVADAPTSGDIADDFRPRYAVDIQVLDMHGKADGTMPILHSVPLPVPVAGGAEMGQFAFPQAGTVVMLQFAYGSPNKPVITAIYPHGCTLPSVADGEHLLQQREGVFQRIDVDGNHSRATDLKITDDCQDYVLESHTRKITTHTDTVEVDGNATRKVKGSWGVRVMGALRLISGSSMNISSADNMAITSSSDLNVNVAKALAMAIKTSAELKAGTTLHLEAPLCHVGNSSTNLFKMVSDLAQAVIDLSTAFASHTHGGVFSGPSTTAVAGNAMTGTTVAANSTITKLAVDVMTE